MWKVNNRGFIYNALCLSVADMVLGGCNGHKKTNEGKRPNIIFIMTDDHTSQAISCYGGNLVQTPNLDRIAREGIRMDRCYPTNALSGPIRACILTGKMSHINGFTDNASRFDGSRSTFVKLLHDVGYQTAILR